MRTECAMGGGDEVGQSMASRCVLGSACLHGSRPMEEVSVCRGHYMHL